MSDWLVIIDMQPAFGDPRSPWYVPAYEACASRIGSLVEGFGDRVVFTRFVPPSRPSGAWTAYYEQHAFALEAANADLWNLDPRWAERMSVASHRFAKWRELKNVLPPKTDLVICGVATDCCVCGTALEAIDAGRHVRFVTDACAAGTDALQDATLKLLADRAPMLTMVDTRRELARLQ